MSFVVSSAAPWIPAALVELSAEAETQGIRNVTRLIARWVDSSERYDRTGESILVARDRASGIVIGVGGLARCPHVEGALRVQRFYVSIGHRRRGVARALAEQLIAEGAPFTTTLTCNAQASAAAPLFWEALGFSRAEIAGITHVRVVERAA